MKRFFYKGIALFLLLSLLLTGCAPRPGGARPTEGVDVATVSAVGDIYLTDAMLADARSADGAYDFSPQLIDVFAALSASDLTIGNFEGTFNDSPFGMSEGSYPDSFAAVLCAAGFDVLQTANSFSIFNGLTGLQRTKSVIGENGMASAGTYYSAEDRSENPILLYEVNGIRIAVIAFTKGMGGMYLPEGAEGCVNLLYQDYTTDYSRIDTDGILSLLQKAREQDADVVIAALHWGSEGVSDASEKQEQLADFLFRNGVDVILGSHSHLVGTVEQRTIRFEDGSEKDVVLAYSLGDFCAAEEGGCSASVILNLEFTRDRASGKTVISEVGYTPIAALDRGAGAADRFAVVDLDNAIALYESNYYDRVSPELYERLVQERERLLDRLTPE